MSRPPSPTFHWVLTAYITILLCSNLIGAGKLCDFFGLTTSAAVLFFPLSYVFGDILTEVYGYNRARKAVWAGFGAMIFASLMAKLVLLFPAAQGWPHQAAYETVFENTPRLVFASLIAYWVGEFSNSYVLAKMKILHEGKQLWKRTIGSTLVGEAIDSIIFYPLAFLGVWPTELLVQVLVTNYFLKVAVEVLFTPATYAIVGFLKRKEGADVFDRDVRFSPFRLDE